MLKGQKQGFYMLEKKCEFIYTYPENSTHFSYLKLFQTFSYR